VSQPIPALSVRQPWAELIISGQKTIELRKWAADYRGQMWLHAGKRQDPQLEAQFGLSAAFRGGFIGVVELSAIVPMDSRRWSSWLERHRDAGRYQPGMFGWILQNARRLKAPIPAPGALGLFVPSPELQSQLQSALNSR
jgi:ASCH domain